MSTTKKSGQKSQVMNKKGKSMSFHGRVADDMAEKLIRPRTVSDLMSGTSAFTNDTMIITRPKLTKLLLNVTVSRSLGPVHVLISPESSVGDLIAAVLRQYVKEGRRPIFPCMDPNGFDLHYSQFSLESLPRDEILNELGSRNFFLCPRQSNNTVATYGSVGGCGEVAAVSPQSSSTCSKEAEKVAKTGTVWLRFMEFLL